VVGKILLKGGLPWPLTTHGGGHRVFRGGIAPRFSKWWPPNLPARSLVLPVRGPPQGSICSIAVCACQAVARTCTPGGNGRIFPSFASPSVLVAAIVATLFLRWTLHYSPWFLTLLYCSPNVEVDTYYVLLAVHRSSYKARRLTARTFRIKHDRIMSASNSFMTARKQPLRSSFFYAYYFHHFKFDARYSFLF
jgi:hypothetical protein